MSLSVIIPFNFWLSSTTITALDISVVHKFYCISNFNAPGSWQKSSYDVFVFHNIA